MRQLKVLIVVAGDDNLLFRYFSRKALAAGTTPRDCKNGRYQSTLGDRPRVVFCFNASILFEACALVGFSSIGSCASS